MKNIKNMIKIKLFPLFTAAIMLITATCTLSQSVYADTQNTSTETVKVGYFAMEGFNEIDEDGLYSGYDYDFFQLLSRYTNLNFEYVGYDKSWQEMQEMLSDGEIDILTSMHSTEERQEKYDFSYDIGMSYTMLTIKMGNTKYQSGVYSSYDGMKVGMLKESSQNDVFEEFAAEKGFSYTAEYFDSVSELSQAVYDGRVDSAVTSSLRQLSGERVIEEIDSSQFYAAVKKGNTALLDEINQAITQMDIYDGDWRNTLYYRYYGYQENSDSEISYSEREQAVIDEYSGGGKTLTVCFDPSLAPYSYVSDGKMVGILPDAIAETLDSIGINYEFVIVNSHDEYIEMYRSGKADVFPETSSDLDAESQEDYLFTDSYFTVRVGMITNKSVSGKIDVVAVPEEENFGTMPDIGDKKLKECSSADEVVSMVLDGEADAGYLMNYTAQMYINREKLSELAYVSQPDIHYDLCFAVSRNAPHEFCSILNKNIADVESKDFYTLSMQYIDINAGDITFLEYLQLHPKIALILFLIILILVTVVTALVFINKRKAEREKQQNDLQRAYDKAEEALADAQQYRHAVLSDAFVIYDANISQDILESDVCEEYGDKKYELLKRLGLNAPCSYDEYLRRICSEMTEVDDRELFRHKTSREYLSELFENGRTEDVFEYRTKLLGGDIADIRHTTYLTKDEKTGDIIAHINNKNITAQKKNERQIRKYEQILITTATDTYKGVRRIDLETGQAEYIRFNDGQITQTDIGDWTQWFEKQRTNIHPDDYERVKNFFSIENLLTMEVGVPSRQDYRSLATNDKDVHRVYTTNVSIALMGKKKIAIITTIDNTAAVENEMKQKMLVEDALHTAEKANRAKTAFLSNMSHDIRTPMNAIIGFTTLAKSHIDDTEQVGDYLEKISSSSIHLLSLINDVLDMSRIESGRLCLDENECRLSEIVENVRSIILPDVDEKGLEFSVDMSGVANDSVICDSLRLNRVLLNLLGNAVKFTGKGGSVSLVAVEKSADLQDDAIYEFHVKDTGIGMSEEFISRVFEPFERERNSTVSGVQGTGLGMSISKNIVDMMGGTISVSSVKGQGSEFTVIIPLKKAVSTAVQKEENAEKSADRITDVSVSGKRVLLVEDNELNREIAAEILSASGLVVEEAEDGSVALEMLKDRGAEYYALVLMDIQMPIMDGYETTRAIRAFEDKKLANVPIVAMTANAFEEDRQTALSAGMNAHIAKPISVDVLLDTIEKVLSGRTDSD